MKLFLFLTFALFSNMAMSIGPIEMHEAPIALDMVETSNQPVCSSLGGQYLTLMRRAKTDDEKYEKASREVSLLLGEKCKKLEKEGDDAIPFGILFHCVELGEARLQGQALKDFKAQCKTGFDTANVYHYAYRNAQEEAKEEASKTACKEKTAVSDLARASKAIERELASPPSSKKTTDK